MPDDRQGLCFHNLLWCFEGLERVNAHRYLFDASDKVVRQTGDLANDLDGVEALHDLLPQHAKLELGHPVAHTAVYAKTKSNVRSVSYTHLTLPTIYSV